MTTTTRRVYTVSMSEKHGAPDAKFVYDITATDAVAAIRQARKRAAADYCLDLRDIMVDEATLDQ